MLQSFLRRDLGLMGLKHIVLESDAFQIVNVVKSNGRNWSRYEQLVEDTQGINMLGD
jgi:hypothetical protein